MATVDKVVHVPHPQHTSRFQQTYAIADEDETLGGVLALAVNSLPGVTFCGYVLAHPLQRTLHVEIHTDGRMLPADAFEQGLETVQRMCAHTLHVWNDAQKTQP